MGTDRDEVLDIKRASLILKIYMGGGDLPNLLQYDIDRSLEPPKLYYVICARPLVK